MVMNRALARRSVAWVDYKGWSLYGAPWLQPLATGRKCEASETARTSRKPLPSVATSCRSQRMVRNAMKKGLPG